MSRRGRNGRYVPTTPGVLPGKRSVSVSAATFARAKERALDDNVSMAWIVEKALAPVLANVVSTAVVTSVPQARRPGRARPAPPPERPIPFWLLPTGPIRRDR